MQLKFKLLTPTAKLPFYAHSTDSGMDICASHQFVLPSHRFKKVMTGLAAVIPPGYELQVRPRSGLAARHGVIACLGTVDEGYRGEIGVTLYSFNDGDLAFEEGERIAQIVLAPVTHAEIVEANDLGDPTERGDNGFGSTGVS